jgi:hypothetical protein
MGHKRAGKTTFHIILQLVFLSFPVFAWERFYGGGLTEFGYCATSPAGYFT